MGDTKLRMSIDSNLVDRLDKLAEKFREVKPNGGRVITFLMTSEEDKPSEDYDLSHTFIELDVWVDGWRVSRFIKPEETIWKTHDEACWDISKHTDGLISILTYGKMCVDINKEISRYIGDFEMEVDLIEHPIYCPVCNHCGETGCCGFHTFLEKHVRGKTDCMYEETILNDLEEFIKDNDD